MPKGSFNTSKITGVHLGAFIGYNFFYSFNESGSLTALPEESFDTSSMVDVGDNFFKNFDANGNITALPGSFQLPSQPQSVSSSYCNYMFYNSALSKGNQLVTLNFRSSAADVFTNTDISPISPATDTVVYVNGTSKSLTKYVITFNPQGGTVSPTSITFQENSSFGTLPTPARSGYIFDSWNSKPDGTGTTYYASTSISANVTAYAIWRQPSSAKEIFSFSLAGVAATISGTSISVTVPYGTSITSATPNISYSVKATITPQGAQNFTSPVKYIVKAEDGSTKTYAVTVKVAGKTVTPTNPDPTPTNPTTPTPGSDKPITNTKVKVTKVSLATAPPIYMVKGRALTLKASVQPYNATNKKLTYKSLSPKIVKVDKNSGKMKALKTGKARIIVTSQDGKKRAACTIIVVAKTLKVKALKSFSPLTLTVGKTKQINTKVTPVKATGVMPAYSSSNKQVATIDKAGVITAHKKGTTAITVKAGGKTKTFKVAVR